MARGAALALLLFGLLGALGAAPDGGFDLSDALPDNENKKPTAIPKKPSAGDDFDLGDAVVDGENDDPRPPNPPKPMPNPNPNHPSSSGSFSDADLADGISGGEGKGGSDGGGSHRKEGEEADAPGVIPGIVGAVVVAVAGAISSFIAYQKKKLCFKENGQPAGSLGPCIQKSLNHLGSAVKLGNG
ncbi:CD99 isoform 8 [Pan troglodytes]|uniref:CD99 isoform 8 n=1 Tax=Pan troglodytes TaxID=9598 RepID=A0A2J8ITL4_PANTR|nr:CD99 isoform 8 [Pan troglodytes]